MPSPTARLADFASRSADRPEFPALVGAVAAADYVLPGAPTNAVLMASVLPRPERWRHLGVAFALGDALGALAVATAVALLGDSVVDWMLQGGGDAAWARVTGWVDTHGLVLLLGLAVFALPARVAAMAFALAETAPLVIGAVILAGRLVAYPTLAYLTAHSPAHLRRFRPFRRLHNAMLRRRAAADRAADRPAAAE